MTENEMVGWHHHLNGHEFEQVPGDGEGQKSLACCSPWGHKVSDVTERLNNNNFTFRFLEEGPFNSFFCPYGRFWPLAVLFPFHLFLVSYGSGGGLVVKLCLTLCDPMDCSLSCSSIHGVSQERKLEWVANSFSRGSSPPRDQTCVSCIAGRFFTD